MLNTALFHKPNPLDLLNKKYQWLLSNKSSILMSFPMFFLLGFSIFVPSFLAFLFGASGKNVCIFIVYAFIYNGLNGFLFLSLLKQNFSENMKIPAILISGICYNILTVFILSFFHLQSYCYLNILFILILNLYYKIDFIKIDIIGRKDFLKNISSLTLFIIPLFIGGAAYVLQHKVNHHFLTQGAIATTLAHQPYPYTNFFFPEVPLFYNYAYHLEMAFCSLLTPISLEELSTRIYPLYTFFLIIYLVHSFCKEFIKGKEISGFLLLFNTFCVVGLFSWSLQLLIQGIPAGLTLVGSSTLGLIMFFLSIYKIYEINNNKSPRFLDYFFLFLLFFIGSISRSVFSIVLGGGVFFLAVTEFLRTWKISSIKNLLIIGILIGITFALALILVYGMFSPYSALGFMKFVPQNTHFMYAYQFRPWISSFDPPLFLKYKYLSSSIAAFVYVIVSAGFLIVGFYYQIFKWIKSGITNLELLLIYCAITGIVIWNFTDTPGGAQYTFFHYFAVIVSMFGAGGTYLVFKDFLSSKNKFLFLLMGLSIALLIVKGYETYDELMHPRNWKDLSFRKKPLYGKFSKQLLDKLKFLTASTENFVIILLSPKYIFLEENHSLYINSKSTPLYTRTALNYLRENVLATREIAERVSNVGKYISLGMSSTTFDDSILNSFKSLFPNKKIVFLLDKKTVIQSNQVKIIEEIDDINIIQYSF